MPDPHADKEPALGTAGRTRKKRRRKLDASIHGPYAAKRCNLCHTRAASNKLKVPKEELCGTCHQPEDFQGEVRHGPSVSGQCTFCHSAHRSERAHLLLKATPALCEQCHTPVTFVDIERHKTERGEDCVRCHDPHAGRTSALLKDEVAP